MHQYLRSIGFRKLQKQPDVWKLLSKVQRTPDVLQQAVVDEDCIRETMTKEFAPGMGITVSGLRYKGRFYREFYYPYIRSARVTTMSPCVISKQGEKDAYVGMCEDAHFGVSLIFYLNNDMDILRKKLQLDVELPTNGIYLAGLAYNGKILMPLQKSLSQRINCQLQDEAHASMVNRARHGDELAMSCLANEDMKLYEMVTKCIATDDLYTMIDTFFMPAGVECDQYMILGEITHISLEMNSLTGEEIYVLELLCNNVSFTVAINKANLLGKPEVGRRFKGDIWLQGSIDV